MPPPTCHTLMSMYPKGPGGSCCCWPKRDDAKVYPTPHAADTVVDGGDLRHAVADALQPPLDDDTAARDGLQSPSGVSLQLVWRDQLSIAGPGATTSSPSTHSRSQQYAQQGPGAVGHASTWPQRSPTHGRPPQPLPPPSPSPSRSDGDRSVSPADWTRRERQKRVVVPRTGIGSIGICVCCDDDLAFAPRVVVS